MESYLLLRFNVLKISSLELIFIEALAVPLTPNMLLPLTILFEIKMVIKVLSNFSISLKISFGKNFPSSARTLK